VVAFDPAQVHKTSAKCCEAFLKQRIVGETARQYADASKPLASLRMCCERPTRGRPV